MKRVYLVRHGITPGNEAYLYQELDTPLSEKGRAQAAFLAERFSHIPFDALIASTMERAQETARAIAQKTGHTVISEALFRERLRPSAVRGKAQTDAHVREIIRASEAHWKTDGKRHSDEENFYDLRNRAVKALDYLIERTEETMVVVTHGAMLRMLLSVMMRGQAVGPDFFEEVERFFVPSNTGITWVEYDNIYQPNRWQLITWNDHAHLG